MIFIIQQDNERPQTVRSSLLPVVDPEICQKKYYPDKENYKIYERKFKKKTKFMFCLGSEDYGMCKGDLGNPAVSFTNSGEAELVGIFSWGLDSNCTNGPGVLTYVQHYRLWIEENANLDDSFYNWLLTFFIKIFFFEQFTLVKIIMNLFCNNDINFYVNQGLLLIFNKDFS